MKKVVSGIATIYHYDIAGNLIAETQADGTPSRDVVYLNGERVAMKLYGSQAGWYFFINDHLGTPQKIVNASGEVVWAGFYQPFGKSWAYPATITNNFRFPGQYYDAETGLHYNWNRYYDPETGRYITADPIGLEGGINLYIYVMNNPINWSDPFGLKLYNIAIKGAGMNAMGHNLTMHIDDKTGKTTYYEVTGPDSQNVHVYKRSENEFIVHYKDRIPELADRNFNETSCIKDKYDVVEVKGVNEEMVLKHLGKMYQEYKQGAKKYPYEWNNNNCATFSYKSYEAGGKQFSPDPYDTGEAPWAWPRDLNQSIRFHNR